MFFTGAVERVAEEIRENCHPQIVNAAESLVEIGAHRLVLCVVYSAQMNNRDHLGKPQGSVSI